MQEKNQESGGKEPRLILPVHLAEGIGRFPALRLRCVPEKLPAAVEMMVRFGSATRLPSAVTCAKCRGGAK